MGDAVTLVVGALQSGDVQKKSIFAPQTHAVAAQTTFQSYLHKGQNRIAFKNTFTHNLSSQIQSRLCTYAQKNKLQYKYVIYNVPQSAAAR